MRTLESRNWNDLPVVTQEVGCRIEPWARVYRLQITAAPSQPESKGYTSSLSTGSYHVWTHTEAGPGGWPRRSPRGPSTPGSRGQSCAVGRSPRRLSRAGAGAGVQLGLGRHRGAALYRWRCGCLHSGRASQCRRAGGARSEVALTTFLSWQPCTLSSRLVQANGFAAAPLSLGVSSDRAPGPCICTLRLLESFHEAFSRFYILLPFQGFPFGLYEHSSF